MISCPAANEIRWVNPSIATVSPSRTRAAIASRIVATFEPVTGGDRTVTIRSAGDLTVVERARECCLRSKPDATHRNLVDRLDEEPKGRRHLGFGHGQGGR